MTSKSNIDEELLFDSDDDDDDSIQLEANQEEINEIVVFGTDWTTATILDQMKRGNIQLNPRFQRRDAWDIGRKSRFIESLILGLPVPPIVLASNFKQKGKYIVLDGKQRLLTILQFYGFSDIERNNSFKLKKLDFKKNLNGLNFENLSQNLICRTDIDSLDNQTIRTTIIRNWKSQNLLHKIFLRLNVENTPLAPQELRQALNPGKFVDFVDDQAITRDSLKIIYPASPDYRMRDTEMLLRYLSYYFFIEKYNGNLKAFLDMSCETLNQEWNVRCQEVETAVESFDQSMTVLVDIFGRSNFSRIWLSDKKGYQSRFNRAIFDVMMFYFSDELVRSRSRENSDIVRLAFQKLCEEDTSFVSSVERTSKNLNETYNRFYLWGKALSKALSIPLNVPVLKDAKNGENRFELQKIE
jgi:hypothetical protein